MAEIRPRRDFMRSLVDPIEDRPGTLSLHALLATGAVGEDALVSLPYMHLISIEMGNEERTQYHQNPYDGGKLHLFGRMPRMYSLAWAMLDSDLSSQGHGAPEGERDPVYHGHTVQDWMRQYNEKFNFSACLKNRNIVRVGWRSSDIYGYVIGHVRSHESKDPNMYSVGMTFLSLVEIENVQIPVYDVTYDPTLHPPESSRPFVSGSFFRETLERYGLLPKSAAVAAVEAAVASWVDQTADKIAQLKAEKDRLMSRG
jgi:hypothetical protein